MIIVWFIFFAIAAASYFFLRFLAKELYIAEVLKDAFLSLAGVVAFLMFLSLVIITFGEFMDYFFPSRIFTKNFNFEPTADVRIYEGSGFFMTFSCSSHLKFRANKETIEKVSLNGYEEVNREYANFTNVAEIKEIMAQPASHYYRKSVSNDNMDIAYDETSQIAYFFYSVSCEE